MNERLIFAIDPGPVMSGYVLYDVLEKRIHQKAKAHNDDVLDALAYCERSVERDEMPSYRLVIEMVACYGMAVGKSVFETCFWAGRFWQRVSCPCDLMYRREVKMWMCNNTSAGDPNVRRALIDKFPPTGGGKTPQIGVKKNPGPLYGVSKDMWAALGVAITFAETKMGGE